MKTFYFHGVEVERCLGCKYIWFDKDELSQALANMGLKPGKLVQAIKTARKEPGSPIGCPCCAAKTVQPIQINGVDIGLCLKCQGLLITHHKINEIAKELDLKHRTGTVDLIGESVVNVVIEGVFQLIFGALD